MELLHTLNRGVDKRKIFMNEKDYFRFVHNLYVFNDQDRVTTNFWHFNKPHDFVSHEGEKKKRKLLVDIHAFCLMPNHYHLLLSPLVENGITKFMMKLNIGYAKYFNEKYKRTGALFEGRYKSVPIENESHFIHIPYYIHLNPLDLCTPEWRQRQMFDSKKAINFLKNYRWSSYLDYTGVENFPSVTHRNFLLSFIGNKTNYEKETISWIKGMDMDSVQGFTLE